LFAANQDKSAITVFALDEILVAHLVPDFRVAQSATPAIAGNLVAGDHRNLWRREYIAFGGHACGSPEMALPRLLAAQPASH
jgi:hypothetical protein